MRLNFMVVIRKLIVWEFQVLRTITFPGIPVQMPYLLNSTPYKIYFNVYVRIYEPLAVQLQQDLRLPFSLILDTACLLVMIFISHQR